MYATYNVNMTTLAVGFHTVFTVDLDFAKYYHNEAALPVKLSRFYLSCKLQA